MEFNFQLLNSIDQRTKDIVNGYIHKVQTLICGHDNNPYFIISDLIISLCIIYYYQSEYFSVWGSEMMIKSSYLEKQNIVEMRSGNWNTAYGNLQINAKNYSNSILKWKIKILNDAWMCFGLDASNKKYLRAVFWSRQAAKDGNKFYCYRSDGFKYSHNNTLTVQYGERYGGDYHAGDEVTLELNVKHKTIKFYKNSEDLGIAFKDFDGSVTYNFAVTISGRYSIQLMQFQACLHK